MKCRIGNKIELNRMERIGTISMIAIVADGNTIVGLCYWKLRNSDKSKGSRLVTRIDLVMVVIVNIDKGELIKK